MKIIIPAYKKPHQLERCLATLRDNVPESDVIVIDNNVTNRGFTKACNDGLLQAMKSGDRYAMLLNQDCYIEFGAVLNAESFMNNHPRCAIAGAKQLLDSDPDFIVHGGCTRAYPRGVHLVGRISNGDCNESKKMPWINGALMVVNLAHVPYIGLMDETMFNFGSESDWCYTARARGFEVWYAANVVCRHECGESAKPSPEMERIMENDMGVWKSKWVGSALHARLVMED